MSVRLTALWIEPRLAGRLSWALVVLGLLLPLASQLRAAVVAQGVKPVLTVATYNVLYRNTNLNALLEMVRGLDAGLVCLQETTPRIEQRLRADLATLYPHQVYQTAKGSGGFGALSRWPLEDVRFLPAENGMRGALLARVTPAGMKVSIEFANVHLRTPQVAGLVSLPGILAGFQKAGEIQDREIRRVHAAFQGMGPRLLMGDFNSFSFGPAQAFLKAQGWTDSLASVHEKPDELSTWRDQRASLGVGFRIDYLFHTSQFRTISSRVILKGSSDHDPVVSQLEWVEPGP